MNTVTVRRHTVYLVSARRHPGARRQTCAFTDIRVATRMARHMRRQGWEVTVL